MCKNTVKEEDKVKLIVLCNNDIDNEEMKELVEGIGQEYEKLFISKKRPSFQYTEYNELLFKELKRRKMISQYKENDGKIQVTALYK